MIAILAASILSPFFVELTPEVRTTYQSLGKLVEDRPMQVTFARAGYDTGRFGRIGIYNFDVSSLTDRRADIHRHALYHTEYGVFGAYDWKIADGWTLRNDLMLAITLYRGFENGASSRVEESRQGASSWRARDERGVHARQGHACLPMGVEVPEVPDDAAEDRGRPRRHQMDAGRLLMTILRQGRFRRPVAAEVQDVFWRMSGKTKAT